MKNKRGKTSFTSFSFLTKSERGQVTIFIILAVLIIGGVALFFSLKGNLKSQDSYPAEVAPIVDFVQECIDDVGKSALLLIGQNGGYYLVPDPMTSSNLPYYLIANKSFSPDKNKISFEISNYVNDNLPLCTGNFSQFKDFVIKGGIPKTETSILNDDVLLKVKYPLIITKSNFKYKVKNFKEVKIPVRLGILYDASKFVINKQIENNGNLCVTCLLELKELYDLKVSIEETDSEIIYSLIDFNSILETSLDKNLGVVPYEFKFAASKR